MPSNKYPRPNDCTWEFYKSCWSIIKSDVLASVQAVFMGKDQFFNDHKWPTVLQKKVGAMDVKDFRPISLVQSFAKLVAKLMALHFTPRRAS
jgi:hypothetical protein